jgi:dTDP-4-dehydrorhamnose reductase
MPRLLVTGGSGLLGSSVATTAAERHEVTATYHSNSISLPGVDCLQLDLTDEQQYDRLPDELDAVVHCAALTDIDRCEREPAAAHTHNVEMTEQLLEIATAADARFVYISTDAVFDGTGRFATEDTEPSPINVYGETKRTAEKRVLNSHPDSVVVRTNIYGWTVTEGQSLAEWVLDRIDAAQTVPAFADVYTTPIDTEHLADCLLELVGRDLTGLLHVAGTERCSKYEFAITVAEVFDRDRSLVTESSITEMDFDAPRGRDLSLSVERAASRLDCSLPDLRTGLKRMRTADE